LTRKFHTVNHTERGRIVTSCLHCIADHNRSTTLLPPVLTHTKSGKAIFSEVSTYTPFQKKMFSQLGRALEDVKKAKSKARAALRAFEASKATTTTYSWKTEDLL
jgi:hypothetical protein